MQGSCFEHGFYSMLCSRYLAHDIEEDDDVFKREVMMWGLKRIGRSHEYKFLKERDQLWVRMDYRAFVSIQCCLQVRLINWSLECKILNYKTH